MKNQVYRCTIAGAIIVLLLFAVSPVSAASSLGTAVISSNPDEGIQICVMGGIPAWNLSIGDNVDATSVNMSIASNDDWIVYVRDSLDGAKPAGTEGRMAEFDPVGGAYVPAGNVLDTPINIRSNAGAYVALSGTNQQIESGTVTPSAGNLYNISVRQAVDFNDPRLYSGHYYRNIVTFVGQNT